jgi:hypothetical protein
LRYAAGSSAECPECRNSVILPGNLQGIAGKRPGRLNNPQNLSMEIGGFLLLFWFPIGSVIGAVLITIGWWKSRCWRCTNCEQITAENATRCPQCGSVFTSE